MTTIEVLRDAIVQWAKETGEFDNENPPAGSLFSYVDEQRYRGEGMIADRLITNRFYFWAHNIPAAIFRSELGEEDTRRLVGELRESMLCYKHSHGANLGGLAPEKIRELFRKDWVCPSCESSRMQDGVERAVLSGLASFSETHRGQLDADAFESFKRTIEDEVHLYEHIVHIVDSNSQVAAFRDLLVAQIAKGYALRRRVPDDVGLHIGCIGLWDNSDATKRIVDALTDAFKADASFNAQADNFKKATLAAMSAAEASLESFEDGLDRGDHDALAQLTLMDACGIPQLYRAAKGEPPVVEDAEVDDWAIRRALEEILYSHTPEAVVRQGHVDVFRRLLRCDPVPCQWIPDWVKHRAEVVWNCIVGAVFGPACIYATGGGGTTTLPVSGVRTGGLTSAAIVCGSEPVRIEDISPLGGRGLVEFGMGTSSKPLPDGVVRVLGRRRKDPPLDGLRDALRAAVDEVFSAATGDASPLEGCLRKSLGACTVNVYHKRQRVPDAVARDELTEAVIGAAATYLDGCGAVLDRKALKSALKGAVNDFFDSNRNRPYEKALLDAEVDAPGTQPGFADRAGIGALAGSKIVTARLEGKGDADEAVDRAVREFLGSAQLELHDKIHAAKDDFCVAEGASATLKELVDEQLADGPKGPVAPVGLAGNPATLDKDGYYDRVDEAIQATESRRDEMFVELGLVDNPDMTVSREHLALRVETGRLVAQNLSGSSASYVKRIEGEGTAYYLLGGDAAARDLESQMRAGGILTDGESVVFVPDGQTITLCRNDILHLGARTELHIK